MRRLFFMMAVEKNSQLSSFLVLQVCYLLVESHTPSRRDLILTRILCFPTPNPQMITLFKPWKTKKVRFDHLFPDLALINNFSNRRGGGSEMAMSPNSVNALKQQFEQTARREYDEAQKTRRASGQRTPPSSRGMTVNKPNSGYATVLFP